MRVPGMDIMMVKLGAAALSFFRRRTIRVALTLLLTMLLGGLLIATIYFTRYDPQWITFLGGVLFAAILALASQASKAEWLVMRRSKQLERLREQFAREASLGKNAARELQLAETKLRLVTDALPCLILFVDHDERCQYHNRAVEEWSGLQADRIDGQLLEKVLGSEARPAMTAQIAQTLAGKALDYEIELARHNGGGPVRFAARQIPFPAEDSPSGFYLFLTRDEAPAMRPARESAETIDVLAQYSDASGEAPHSNFIARDLTRDDPRTSLARALRENEFLLLAQKILPLKTNVAEPECYEILLRLREEEDNLLPPGGFIPVAEHYGMMEEIDRWVIRNLIAWCIGRQQRMPAWQIPMFCVNLFEVTIGNPEFARFVRHELQHLNFPARALCFELSAPEATGHAEDARHFIAALRPAGCRFALGASGSIDASIARLDDLPADFIKIDSTIIRNLLGTPAGLATASALNAACRKTGVRTIAQFVESAEMLDKLRGLGVDYVQGFGISFPQPITDIVV